MDDSEAFEFCACDDCAGEALMAPMGHSWTWRFVPIIGARVAADVLEAFSEGLRNFANCLVGVTLHEDERRSFHEQASLEIESITATPED